MPTTVTLRRPDDWHLHLRDGAMLAAVLPATARVFARAIVMPNLDPPVTTAAAATAYRARIRAALPADASFTPLMTCYLTDSTDPDDLATGFRDGVLTAAKLYPAGATFQATRGVTDIAGIMPVLARMQDIGMPLCVHGEVVDPAIDVFDREAVFIDRVLEPLRRDLPGLRIVLEHATTAAAVAWVRAQDRGAAATLTPHHLLLNRNAMFQGGLRPHHYCLPLLKRERDRLALVGAATSGDGRFFLGTDSAPHAIATKETACGCAGIYCAPVALASYAQVFEAAGALHQLEAFASLHGPAWYGLPANEERIVLERTATPIAAPASDGPPESPVAVFAPPGGIVWRLR